jgi:hypothetical protein
MFSWVFEPQRVAVVIGQARHRYFHLPTLLLKLPENDDAAREADAEDLA